MEMFTSGIFWGILLVFIGLSIIIKVVFDINIPVFRIGFALLLIYLGVKLLIGISDNSKSKESIVFGEGKVEGELSKQEYNVLFGKGHIDLTGSSVNVEIVGKKKINVIFGQADVLVSDTVPVCIKSSSAFGAINFPDKTIISFGERQYNTSPETVACTEIELNVVFGQAEIIRK
ncbi:MAG: hypothetical protein ACK40G_01500 [Cytophagaceae bacterium]